MSSQLREPERPPFWRNERILRIAAQIAAVIIAAAVLWKLYDNLTTSLEESNLPTDFGVLEQPTNFAIRDDPGFDDRSPIFPNMLWVGIKNTAIAAFVGIIIAVILGTLIGIGRLSTNWLVQKMSTVYVETIRNIPPIVIIAFFGFAVFTFGPFPEFNPRIPPWQYQIPGTDDNFLILSKDRWGFPSMMKDGYVGLFWFLMLGVAIMTLIVWKWRTKINRDTGAPHHRVLYSFLTFVGFGAMAFAATGVPYRWSWPAVSDSGRIIQGGFATNAGYISVTVALGLYTASHIAEITRGSILAVPKGQTEAANALALNGFQRYRFVVLPQAARIAIPPMINQFLNLTKNTSLATVVAYPDITALAKTAIGNGKPAVQMLAVLMIIYLGFSFFWSILLNVASRRLKTVGR
jgi:general L-amino acid transport system permease protein